MVLKAKYGVGIVHSPNMLDLGEIKNVSLWWKDLCWLGRKTTNEEGDWCSDIMVKKLGNGGRTRFWLDNWEGPTPLCYLYPRLFSISLQTQHCIDKMGEWRNGEWFWNFKWRRRLFVWEEESVT
jgi:hypothetical protein